MDFAADLHAQIMETLPHDPADRSLLAAKSPGELLIWYLNWRGRFVPAIHWRVHISQALASKRPLSDPDQESALDAIVATLRSGGDVTPHLSRSVTQGFTSRRRRRNHLDLMLNDWGVHHLHLSTVPEADGFVVRTGPILFAAFVGGDAWLIDVIPHGKGHPNAWTTQSVLQTIATEWPDSGLLLALPGIEPSRDPATDDERRNLRANGYAAVFEHGDTVYMPRALGISSGGTSTRTSGLAMNILARMRHVEKELRARVGPVWSAFASQPDFPASPDFTFVIGDDGIAVVEGSTGIACAI